MDDIRETITLEISLPKGQDSVRALSPRIFWQILPVSRPIVMEIKSTLNPNFFPSGVSIHLGIFALVFSIREFMM